MDSDSPIADATAAVQADPGSAYARYAIACVTNDEAFATKQLELLVASDGDELRNVLIDADCPWTAAHKALASKAKPSPQREATEALAKADQESKPPGWSLSPRAVETYVMGSAKPVGGVAITPKYVGDRAIVQVAIATLASDRALMLAGEPGTAKSWLSEHLSAAISGTSALVVQGTAGTSEEHIKYGWNYALLLAEGPSPRALVVHLTE